MTRADARKAAGLCAYCGKRVPQSGRSWCEHCLTRDRKRPSRVERTASSGRFDDFFTFTPKEESNDGRQS